MSLRDHAYIFDLDETLFHTFAKLIVMKDNEEVIRLDNRAFNTYTLKKGESFDFSEFNNKALLMKSKPLPFLKIAQNITKAVKNGTSNSFIYILTARSSVINKAIHSLLKKNGVEVRPQEIYAIGDIAVKTKKPIAEVKKDILLKIRKKHIGTLTFFDDDERNIKIAKKVKGIDVRKSMYRTFSEMYEAIVSK